MYVSRRGKSGPNVAVAGAFAHPAFLDEGHFERIERASPSMRDLFGTYLTPCFLLLCRATADVQPW